mgnify:CR=1 FL=1
MGTLFAGFLVLLVIGAFFFSKRTPRTEEISRLEKWGGLIDRGSMDLGTGILWFLLLILGWGILSFAKMFG